MLVPTTSMASPRRPAGASSGRAASTKPRKPLPPSPRKSDAGGQLRIRKPAVAAAASSASRVASPLQPRAAIATRVSTA